MEGFVLCIQTHREKKRRDISGGVSLESRYSEISDGGMESYVGCLVVCTEFSSGEFQKQCQLYRGELNRMRGA